jgi:hypothetical protein
VDNQPPEKKYEDILRQTLLKRTGKSFRRNLEQAPDPTQNQAPPESHEDLANRIFDNILQKQRAMRDNPQINNTPVTQSSKNADLQRSQSQQKPTPESRLQDLKSQPLPPKGVTSINQRYSDILDDILWPDGDPLDSNASSLPQDTLAENSPYKNLLRRTLERKSESLGNVNRSTPFEIQEPGLSTDELSQQYADQLDEILNLNSHPETSFVAGLAEDTSLTQTLYHQRLDNILWPKDERGKPIPPPVDEQKVRAAVADFLRQFIQPEIYSLITVKRQVTDETFGQFWINQVMLQLRQELNEAETRFTAWFLMNNLSLIKPLISAEFIERNRMIIEHLMPQKKADQLFKRTLKNKEQNLIFDRMINNKFEDVRRILKTYFRSFSEEDAQHIFNFLRIKLPEFLLNQQELLMTVLRAQSPDVGGHPFVTQFLYSLFFNDDFREAFSQLQDNEQEHKKSFQQFLKQLAETFGDPEDLLLPTLLSAIDLYHEKARFFSVEQRSTLAEALELVNQLLYYVPEASFDKEGLLGNIQNFYEERTQAQYHAEAQTLEQLGKEIGELSRQGGPSMHIRVNHLNKIYERHQQQMSDLYHKRRDTLTKWLAEESPGGQKRSRKHFVQRKVKSAQQFLTRNAIKSLPALTVPYKVYPAPFLDAQQSEIKEQYPWENSFEEEIAELAFGKARLVLKAINESKSTVQLNLKILFNAEPRQSEFLKVIAALRTQMKDAHHLEHHPGFVYVKEAFTPYFEGLRLPHLKEPLGMTYREMAGYIVGYLGHTSHLRLLLKQQYKQVVYDFRELFKLAHALQLFALIQEQHQSSFPVLFQHSLFRAWDLLVEYCLFVGEGKYDFIGNPLSLQDFTWAPPLSDFGAPAFAGPEVPKDKDFDVFTLEGPNWDPVSEEDLSTGFSLLSLDDPDEDDDDDDNPAIKELESPSAFRFGTPDATERPALPAPGSTPAQRALPPGLAPTGAPELPPAPGRRRLPGSPGKFNMYQPPRRPGGTQPLPPLPAAPQTDTKEHENTHHGEFTLPGTLPITPHHAFELSSTQDLPPKKQPPPSAAPEERKGWLEITSEYNDNKRYNQVVDKVLENNQLNPNAPTPGETMLPSNFKKRRKPRF